MKSTEKDAHARKPAKKRPGRAPVSCAECRRLKMKCDRAFPCENCTKRGCAAICPDGTLTTGKHNRMILSNTEELHDKIESLLHRIRLLEDALRSLQASISTEPHPLLLEPTTESILSTIHVYPSHTERKVHQSPTIHEEEESLDLFGSLSIGSDGETSFFGQTARADYLLNDDSDSDDDRDVGRLPRGFYSFSWPECPPPDNSIEETVLSYLPDLNEAYALTNIYCSMSSWMGFLLPRDMIREEIIAHVYHVPNRPWASTLPTCPHRLALLFAIFSLGAFFNPSREPNSVRPDDYYHLARVALSFKSAVLETTTYAVLAVTHMAYVSLLRDSPDAHEQGWVMLGVANKLAIGMGLHRDSSRWHLDEELSERRHITFWQLYLLETMASFHFGRPTLLSDNFIECPYPKFLDRERKSSTDHASQCKYMWPSDLSWLLCFSRLARRTLCEIFGAKKISYHAILEIDSEIRALPDPNLRDSGPVGEDDETSTTEKVRWCINRCKETMLLHIHRGFLMEALIEDPYNLPSSKYSKSVQACFESSFRLIESVAWVSEQCPQILSRISTLFGTSISAAVVMCVIATRCPNSELAYPAVEKLDIIHSAIQKASGVNSTARKNLVLTRRLRNLARTTLDKSKMGAYSISLPPEEVVVLSRGCGKSHVRARKECNREGMKYRRRRDVDDNLASQQQSENWTERPSKTGQSLPPMTANSSSNVDEFMRYGFPGDNFNASSPFVQGLDSSWNTFIQSFGF